MAGKSENFAEWTKEEKAEFAEKRMQEMRKKNEALQKRYAEVEGDRIAAESRNSAVTVSLKTQRRENRELPKSEGKTEYTREWDRGKPDKDWQVWYWNSHEELPSSYSFKSYRTGRSTRLGYNPTYSNKYDKDTRGSFSRKENSDNRYDRAADHHQSRKPRVGYNRYDNYRSSEGNRSPKHTRDTAARSNEMHKKSQHSYFDEKSKRNYYDAANSTQRNSYGAHSRSSSWSGSDYEQRKRSVEAAVISSANSASLWNNDSYKEQQNALNRVEKWVVNVNKCQQVTPKKGNQHYKRYNKFDRPSNHSSDDEEDNCVLPSKTTSGSFKSTERSSSYPQKTKNSGDVNYISARQEYSERAKGFKSKLSPESSSAYDKSEQLHKHGRFDNQDFRNDNKNMFNKNKTYEKSMSKNDARFKSGNMNKNARYGNMFIKNWVKNASLQKSETWNQGADFKITKTVDSGGVWNDVQQSDVNWKMNEKTDSNNQNYMMSEKDAEKDSWGNYDVQRQESKKEYLNQEDNKKSNPQDPEDLWGNVDQSDVKWNISDEEKDSSSPPKNTISKDENKSVELCKRNLARDGWLDSQPRDKNKPAELGNKSLVRDGWRDSQPRDRNKSAELCNKNLARDGWRDSQPRDKNKSAEQCNKKLDRDGWRDSKPIYDEGSWSNVDQGDVKWNLSDSEESELIGNKSVSEGCENSYPKSEFHEMNINEFAGKMAEKCQIDDGKGYSTVKNPVGPDEVSSTVDDNSRNPAADDDVNEK